MADQKNPVLIPAGGIPSRAALPDDDFSRRMGYAVAASLGVNFLLFTGAGMLAQSMQKAPDVFSKIDVTLRPVVATPLPATPAPVPSALPSVAVATPVPVATPVAKAEPTPKPISTPIPTPRPRAFASAATPRPVITPAPTPRPTAKPLETKNIASAAAVAATAIAATQANNLKASPTSRTNDAKPADVKNTTLTAQQNNNSVTTISPQMQREIGTLRPTSAKPLLGKQNGTTFVAKSATNNANTSASNLATSASADRANTVSGRASNAPAMTAPSVLNPVVIQPEARSTFSGETRQVKTVAGVASHATGRTRVVTLSSKASDASPTNFTYASGGTLKAGQATARQGGAGTNAVAMVSGAPTAITTGGEYAVYAPVPETRGVIGVRGTNRSPIGGTVTNLQAKGNIAEVAAGNAVYAAAPSGTAKNAAQARVAAQQAGITGTLSAQPGAGVGGGPIKGESRSADSSAVKGTGNGVGGKARGPQLAVGGGAGGPRGGNGVVAGDPNGVAGGTPRAGQVGAKVTQAGAVGVKEGGGPAVKNSVEDKNVTAAPALNKKDPVKINTDIEQEQLASSVGSQVAATPVSKPEPDIPDSLRSVKFSGKIVIKVTVEANGSHSESIVKGTGNPELDDAILAGVRRWRWNAAKQDGKAVRSDSKISLSISNG